jgi:hypothetical protein
MQMLIRFQNGFRGEGVLLVANSERMRVVIVSERDAVELHKVGMCWYTETGAPIEIEALIPIEGTDFSHFCSAEHPRTNAAGRALEAA